MKTYYITIHDTVFEEVQDEKIANRIAALYRKIGWEDVKVTTEEPV